MTVATIIGFWILLFSGILALAGICTAIIVLGNNIWDGDEHVAFLISLIIVLAIGTLFASGHLVAFVNCPEEYGYTKIETIEITEDVENDD